MWFFVCFAYWALSARAIEQLPLIESLPNDAFSTPVFYNAPSCYSYAARRTGIAWCATDNNADPPQYLQVEFGQEYEIDSVSTWPRTNAAQYVKTYTLSYSLDGESFTDYGQTLNGNTAADVNQEVNNVLDPDFTARFLRFTPLEFAGHKSMRIEAYGNKAAISCDAFEIDEFLASCSALFSSNVDGISAVQDGLDDVNERLDVVITNIGGAWGDLSSANAMPMPMPVMPRVPASPENSVKINVKSWFDNYRDYLIVLSLSLNVLVIGFVWCVSKKKKYDVYENVKYVGSSDNENAAINM